LLIAGGRRKATVSLQTVSCSYGNILPEMVWDKVEGFGEVRAGGPDETKTEGFGQTSPALWVFVWRAPGSSSRSADAPHRPSRLSCRIATQN
jgi:hypothetical protein